MWTLTLAGKILCYAIVAVALDLVWGYAGMLSLGHGIFFTLGVCDGNVPDAPCFRRRITGLYVVPVVERAAPVLVGTQHFLWAMLLVVLVPGLLALVFSWFAFRSKIKGVYFSIHHDPGPDFRRNAAVFRNKNRFWK